MSLVAIGVVGTVNVNAQTTNGSFTGTIIVDQPYQGNVYNADGSVFTGTPQNGAVYYTSTGSTLYYVNGWYYYPITSTGAGTTTGTIPGTTVPNTTFTPGVPSTGLGGELALNMFALATSGALAVAGGLAYLRRRVGGRVM